MHDAPAATVVLPGQVTAGGVLSVTVKVLTQVEKLPASSVAVTVTLWTPTPTGVPAAGDCVSVTLVSQLSEALAVAVKSGTVAEQLALANAD